MDSFLTTVLGIGILVGVGVWAANWWSQRGRGKKPTRRFYVEALRLALSGDDERAFAMFRRAALEDTNNADAYLRAGDILRKRGKVERATRIHGELTMRPRLTAEEKSAALRSLVLDHVAAGRHELALETLARMEAPSGADEVWALAQRIECCERLARWDDAAEALEKLAKKTGRDESRRIALYRFEQGRAVAADGHRARLKFRDAIRTDARCVAAYLALGDSYVADDRPEDALAAWADMARAVPSRAHLCFERYESVLYELGKYDEAEEFYSRLIERDPSDAHALTSLAALQEKKGRWDEAASLYDRVAQAEQDGVAKMRKARAVAKSGDRETALREFVDAVEREALAAPRYLCAKCGHESTEPEWHCPRCGAWDSFGV